MAVYVLPSGPIHFFFFCLFSFFLSPSSSSTLVAMNVDDALPSNQLSLSLSSLETFSLSSFPRLGLDRAATSQHQAATRANQLGSDPAETFGAISVATQSLSRLSMMGRGKNDVQTSVNNHFLRRSLVQLCSTQLPLQDGTLHFRQKCLDRWHVFLCNQKFYK